MNQTNNNIPKTVDEIADRLIDDMSLKDRVTMANLEDDQIEFFNQLISKYIENKLIEWPIEQGEMVIAEPRAIIKEIWNRLRETHKLRIVE